MKTDPVIAGAASDALPGEADPGAACCYCVFCAGRKCDTIAAAIRQKFGYTAFSPRIIQRKWVRGECLEEVRPYLPGYVFFYSRQPVTRFREICMMEGVARCLGERDADYLLQGEDMHFARMLYARGGVIGIMKAYREGDRVRLARSMLGGFEGEIIRLDRRKGRAQLQYNFDGNCYKVWVGYEMIEDPPEPERE